MKTFSLEETAYGWRVWSMAPNGGRRGSACTTEAEARAFWDELQNGPKCHECGDPIWARHDNRAEKMLAEQLCSTCYFWTHMAPKGEVVIVNGFHYEVGETEQAIARRTRWPLDHGRLPSRYRHVLGHGGSEFSILFHDGHRVVTTNLWAHGEIPPHFRDRMPDNAVFEQAERSAAYVGHGSASV